MLVPPPSAGGPCSVRSRRGRRRGGGGGGVRGTVSLAHLGGHATGTIGAQFRSCAHRRDSCETQIALAGHLRCCPHVGLARPHQHQLVHARCCREGSGGDDDGGGAGGTWSCAATLPLLLRRMKAGAAPARTRTCTSLQRLRACGAAPSQREVQHRGVTPATALQCRGSKLWRQGRRRQDTHTHAYLC